MSQTHADGPFTTSFFLLVPGPRVELSQDSETLDAAQELAEVWDVQFADLVEQDGPHFITAARARGLRLKEDGAGE